MSKLNKIISSLLVVFSPCIVAGCHDDPGLSPLERGIEVVPYTTDMNYLETNTESRTINLGDVPVYSSHQAIFEIRNTTTQLLTVESIDYVDSETSGETWGDVTWRNNIEDSIAKLAPFSVPGQSSRLIQIPFAPQTEDGASAKLIIKSNASGSSQIEINVLATGKFVGQPDIEISYNGHTGPSLETDCTDGVCTMPTPLNFGNIGLGTQSTARITLRNTAHCPPFPGGDSCMSCALTISPNPENQNLGLNFKEGTNDDGRFAFAGSTTVPFTVAQADVDCNNSGEIKILLTFTAPETESDFATTIVIESNDTDEPVIEIPVRATSKNAPIAIAEIRECGTLGPDNNLIATDCSYPDEIAPLNYVHLQGGNSFDPSGGTITTYQWEIIEHPMDDDFDDFDLQGQGMAVASFWVPVVGDYTVLLTVTNENGVTSGITEQAKVTFHASPESILHVQLTWDDATNDQDLHLTHASAGGHFCSNEGDCFYTNKQPNWFQSDLPGKGPNPRLDIDDTAGLGPENINIDRPQPGVYRVFVHNYPKSGIAATPTMNVLRIYLSGVLVFSQQRVLTEYEQVWAAADITWIDDNSEFGSGTVEQFPNPTGSNEVGAIAIRDPSQCGTPTGWVFPGE